MNKSLSAAERNLIHRLHESQLFVEEVANSTPDIIYVLDLEKRRIIYTNDQVHHVLGPDNLHLDIIHPQDYQARTRHLMGCFHLNKDEFKEIDIRLKVKDGSWNWFRVRDKAFKFNGDGSVVKIIGVARNIQEQKLAEENMKHKEMLLQGLLLAPNIGVKVCKAIRAMNGEIIDFEFIALSKLFEDLYERNDLVGKWLFEEFPTAKLREYGLWKKLVETGEPVTRETEFHLKDKNYWFRIHYSKFDDGWMSMWEDITEKKLAELRMNEHVDYINNLLRTMPEVINVMNLHTGKIEFINADPNAVLGFSEEEVTEITTEKKSQIVHPDDRIKRIKYLKRIRQGGDNEMHSVQLRLKNKSGKWIWTHIRSKVFKRDEFGNVSHCVNIAQDITDVKMMEEQLLHNELFVQSIINSTPEAIVIFDINEEKLLYASPYIEKLLGFTPEELNSFGNLVFRACIHPEDVDEQIASHRKIGEANNGEISEYWYRMIHKSGRVKNVYARKSVFKRDENGNATQIIAVISELRSKWFGLFSY